MERGVKGARGGGGGGGGRRGDHNWVRYGEDGWRGGREGGRGEGRGFHTLFIITMSITIIHKPATVPEPPTLSHVPLNVAPNRIMEMRETDMVRLYRVSEVISDARENGGRKRERDVWSSIGLRDHLHGL